MLDLQEREERMTDDNGRRTTGTFKAGAGHNVPWLVFNGIPDEIRQDIVTTFGWDAGQAFDVSLAELVLNVSKYWQDVATVADKLDGQAVSGSRPKPIKKRSEERRVGKVCRRD